MLCLWDGGCRGNLFGELGRCEAALERIVGLFEAAVVADPDTRDTMGGGFGPSSGVPFAYMNLLDTLSWLRFEEPGDSGGESVVGLAALGAMSLPLPLPFA